MAKARHIDETEFRRAVAVASSNRYSERDKLCLLLTGRAGMRVNEIRMLNVSDIYDHDLGGWDGPASFFNQEGFVGHAKGVTEANDLKGSLPYLEVSEDEF